MVNTYGPVAGARPANMSSHELVLLPPGQQEGHQGSSHSGCADTVGTIAEGDRQCQGGEDTLTPREDNHGWWAEGRGQPLQQAATEPVDTVQPIIVTGWWGTVKADSGTCAYLRGVRRRQQASSKTQHYALALTLCCICISFLCSATARSTQQAGVEEQEQLRACLQEGQQFQVTTWNSSVLEDALPNLVLHATWWSSQQPRLNLTIITQLSVDRAAQLLNQCSSFLGPMAAAVYLPIVQDPSLQHISIQSSARLQAAVEQLADLHSQAEANGRCQLDIMLFYEVFDYPITAQLYPVNALRNFARMQVRTQLLAAVDVDMMISGTLSQGLQQPEWVADITRMAVSKVAVVLPALEPLKIGDSGRASADRSVTATKADIALMMKQRELRQFKLRMFPRGHTPTNYSMWPGAELLYAVRYQRMYEPWFISHWDVMPWFDVNFKGYGLNKIVHVASLNYYGFTFAVHPNLWLVHRPHLDTAVRRTVTRQASDVNKLGARLPQHALYSKVTSLFSNAKRAMVRGDYTPRLDPRMVRCMRSLGFMQPLQELHSSPVEPSVFA